MKHALQKFWRGAGWKLGWVTANVLGPVLVLAQTVNPGGTQSTSIQNPIAADSFAALLELVLNIIIDVGLPIIVIAIIWVGFKYVMAQGKPAEIQKAHEAIKWVLVGAAIVIGAKVIVAIVTNTIETIK